MVFDCDGTLVDSRHSITDAMCAAFSSSGFEPPSSRSVRRQIGLPLLAAVENLLPGADENTHTDMVKKYRAEFSGLRRRGEVKEPLFPDVQGVLNSLKDSGWLLGVATGKSMKGLVSTLERHRLMDIFFTLQTADIAPGKPHPAMMLRAMDEAGVNSAVMVGDTTYDIEMARSAGALAIGVSWGYHDPAELRAAGADAVADRFADLPAIIESLTEDML